MRKLVISCALLVSSIGIAHADTTFVGASYGKNWSNLEHNSTARDNLDDYKINNTFAKENTWGVRAGRDMVDRRFYATFDQTDGQSNGTKLKQQNLLGSADYLYPVAENTRVFAGLSAGVNRLVNETAGYSNDHSYGFTYGAQAGVLQTLSKNWELEGGAKYLKNNNSVDYRDADGKQGTAKLTANKQVYIAMNYHF